ncbi:MAG TPA: deoxyribodipyrimidine photolyase [Planctomycetota bacterium]|nr:deoxyribodipyrimidine photolyase [Planctomycetota bacterium]
MNRVPELRIRAVNERPVARDRDHVLYWSTAYRRPTWNFALQRAVEWSKELDRPLLVLDALGVNHPWASERIHAFVLGALADNAATYAKHGVQHYAYVEPKLHAGRGLLARLAERACVVVGDDYPCFVLPRFVAAGAKQVDVRMEVVDSNGLLPLRATDRVFPTAYAFRRFLQKSLPEHLPHAPLANPLRNLPHMLASVPKQVERDFPRVKPALLAGGSAELARLPIDHAVTPVELRGGHVAAAKLLEQFLARRLLDYEEQRNHPDADVASGLSPYFHFGMLSSHQVFAALAAHEEWTPEHLSADAKGARLGFYGMRSTAESFLDQAVTWRELGFHECAKRADYDRYESLPPWALLTLERHESDPRPQLYDLDELERAATYDPLWNAAQNELVTTGRMQNYLRMLWGKKILEWSPSPRAALGALLHLNDKYALDGRDPNSISGIFWCLGRYDRAFGPERAIFGKVRYMSSQNTARKLSLQDYLARFGVESPRRR